MKKYPSKDVYGAALRMSNDAERAAKKISKKAGWLAVVYGACDFVINQMPAYVRQSLDRVGIHYEEGEEINIASFTQKVSSLSGIPLSDLSNPELTKKEVESWAIKMLNRELNIEFDSLQSPKDIKRVLKDRVLDALVVGHNRFVAGSFLKMCSDAARDANSRGESLFGSDIERRAKQYRNRVNQRSWETNHNRQFD